MSNINERLFDQRVVERNIKRGKITREQYEAWLESTEDCAELAEDTATRFVRRIPEEEGEEG